MNIELKEIRRNVISDTKILIKDVKRLMVYHQEHDNEGAKCPECGCVERGVVNSRTENNTKMRRRECSYCHCRWTTLEVRVEGSW